MKRLICLLLVVLMASTAYAYNRVENIFDGDSVETENTVTSRAFRVGEAETYAIWYKAEAELNDPNIDINIEYSYDSTATNFATGSTVTIVDDLTNQTAHVTSITAVGMPYIRFKAVGNSGNTTGTTIVAKLFTRE